MATTTTQHLERADAYRNHWTQVNALLGATPLVLRGAYTLAQLTTDLAAPSVLDSLPRL